MAVLMVSACSAVRETPPPLSSGRIEYTIGKEWRITGLDGTRNYAEATAVPCDRIWFPRLDQPAQTCLVFDPGVHGLGEGPLRVAVLDGSRPLRVLMLRSPKEGGQKRHLETDDRLAADFMTIHRWLRRR